MDNQKEYCDVFFKDPRNRYDSTNGNKGMGYKQVQKRNVRILKRQAQAHKEEQIEQNQVEVQQKTKKYGNGKPKREVKQQEVIMEDEREEGKGCKRYKKQRYYKR